MLNRPAFKQHFHVEHTQSEGTYLLSEVGHYVLFGEVSTLVAATINGVLTSDEIADALNGQAELEEIYTALTMMERDGYLVESDDGDRTEAAFWTTLGVDPRAARTRVAERGVAVQDLTGELGHVAEVAMRRAGLKVVQAVAGDVTLVLVDDYLDPRLATVASEHAKAGRPWLLCKPQGFFTWVGPFFLPGESACWECVAERLRANREVEGLVERHGGISPPPVSIATSNSAVDAGVGSATLQLRLFVGSGGQSALVNRITTVNWSTLVHESHHVVRRPQCHGCGDPSLALNSDEVPLPRPTGPVQLADGGLRGVSAEETYERFRHLVSPVTGVVKQLVRIGPASGGPLHVYAAGHNFALKNDSLYFLQEGLRTNSAGKGRSDAQARTSALCEAIERYSGVFRGDERRMTARLADLDGLGIHPNDCMLFSDRQFQNRDLWLSRKSRFQVVPHEFNVDLEVEWTPVRSLTSGGTRYLPTGYLFYGYPLDQEKFEFWADSNGNAAGNTLEESALQGFLELAERDAVCIWWYNGLRRPAVDLATVNDSYVDELQTYYAGHGREFWVLDLTNDLGVPTYAAINRRVDHPTEDIILGFGAHLDPRTALLRAVSEMNQFMPAVLDRNPDGTTRYAFDDEDSLHWWRTATIANQPYLAPMQFPLLHLGAFPSLSAADAGADLLTCVKKAASLGLETLALNQSRPDIGLPVVKVIVPGLRHFWARFAPGRLFDVPVRLGWQAAPTPEEALNPTAMFL